VKELYSIGDVARRTGLSVSAIRFYADAGVVAPTEQTDGGFRRYDVHAIARLEVVRTLRELGASLDDIRAVLLATSSLHELATAHLALVEGQLQQLTVRRAVLRTIVALQTPTEQVSLMHKLVSMSDGDRERLIDEFWSATTDGLDIHPGYVDRLHSMRPHLSEDPSAEQVEAWVELAGMVQDQGFRQELREFLRRTFQGEPKQQAISPEMQARFDKRRALFLEARAAREAGVPEDSPEARDIAERLAVDAAEFAALTTGQYDLDEARRRMTTPPDVVPSVRQAAGLDSLRRYQSLVTTINGTTGLAPAASTHEWVAAALRDDSAGGTA
jgi:DNA-binding transcriptional MerR regulator